MDAIKTDHPVMDKDPILRDLVELILRHLSQEGSCGFFLPVPNADPPCDVRIDIHVQEEGNGLIPSNKIAGFMEVFANMIAKKVGGGTIHYTRNGLPYASIRVIPNAHKNLMGITHP